MPSNRIISCKSGDIIYKIDGKSVFILDNLNRYMKTDKMTFTVLRPVGEGDNVKYEEVVIENIVKSDYVSVVVSKLKGKYFSGERELSEGDTIYKFNGKPLGAKATILKICLPEREGGVLN